MKKEMGSCGLACVLCLAMLEGKCMGCSSKIIDDCDYKMCHALLNTNACYECKVFPCDRSMFKSPRVRGFVKAISLKGEKVIIERLTFNDKMGIKYHPEDGSTGDYDQLHTVEEVIDLILQGRNDEKHCCD